MNTTIKKIILGAGLIVASLISFYGLHLAFYSNYYGLVLYFLALPMGYGILVTLLDDFNFAMPTFVIASLTFLLFLPFNMYYLLCVFMLILLMVSGFLRSVRTKQYYLKSVIDQVGGKSLGYLFWGISLIIGVVACFCPQTKAIQNGDINIPFDYEVKLIQMAVPEFSADLTVDQAINTIIRQPITTELPQETKQALYEKLGIGELKLTGNEVMGEHPEILNTIFKIRIKMVTDGVGRYLPAVLAYLVFSAAIIVGKIALQLAILLDLAIIYLLNKFRFFSVQKVTVTQEKITL